MSDGTRIVGGLLVGMNGHLFSTSVRHEVAYCPACWRCGNPLYLDKAELVANGEDAHPWTWVCSSCVSPNDVAARENPEGRGVR